MQFLIVTVYYNEDIAESETWRTLLADIPEELDVIRCIVDNSTAGNLRETNRSFALRQRLRYLDMEGNEGLPAAYNRAITQAIELGDLTDAWVITADQDTTFPKDYLRRLAEEAEQTKAMVLAPMVKSKDRILSPCKKTGARFGCCTEEELAQADGRELYFINSGLCLRGTIFTRDGLRYNEELFLDFADFDLERRICREHPGCARVLSDLVLEQGFSGMDKGRSAQQDLERYRRYVHDGEIFYKTWGEEESAYRSVLQRRGWKLALRHRDARFLKKK